MNRIYVSSHLFASLAALGVGDVGTSAIAGETCGGQAVGIFVRLRQREGHLHENQLCERRSRSCFDRFANEIFDGRGHATFQRQFIALDQREQSGGGQVWMGTRLRGVFGIRINRGRSRALHLQSGRTSPEQKFPGRIETICGTIRLGMARGLKPLKRFQHSPNPSGTSLKRGVNENGEQQRSFSLRRASARCKKRMKNGNCFNSFNTEFLK